MLRYRYVFSYGRLDPVPGSICRGSDGMRSIATFLPAIFRELLKKAVREAAPIIPAHFNLVMPGGKEDLITASQF